MITINIDKAKTIAHDIRRATRAEEFAPHDEVIAKRIPGVAEQEAEAAREEIRAKHEALQAEIEAAASVEELQGVLKDLV